MPDFITADGIRLHFSDEGRGIPVLCLAGLTRNLHDFDHLAAQLKDVRLIRMDYRGRGRSDWADPATYTVPQEAADAVALLDHLGIDRAAVIGTSRGGLIGMWLAKTAKNRLSGLCLNDIGPELATRGLEVIRGYLGRNPAQNSLEAAARARAQAWTGFSGVPHARWLAEVTAQYRETPAGLEIRYDPRLRQAMFGDDDAPAAKPPAQSMWPLFEAAAGLPLCLIRGANSELLTPDTAARMRQQRPDMIWAEVPGRGHVPFLDEPESLAAIRAWIGKMQ